MNSRGGSPTEPNIFNPRWTRVGSAVAARRHRLGLTQARVVAAGGPSDVTLRKIEQGEPSSYRGGTLANLERILQWPSGTIKEIHDAEADASIDPWVNAPTQGPATPSWDFQQGQANAAAVHEQTRKLATALLEHVNRFYGPIPQVINLVSPNLHDLILHTVLHPEDVHPDAEHKGLSD